MAALVARAGQRIDPAELAALLRGAPAVLRGAALRRLLADLPRTENGKVQKFKLRERGVTAITWDRGPAGARAGQGLNRMAAARRPLFSLAGRAAFVTGAGQGLGAAIARGLAEAGARVVLADIDAAAVDAVAAGAARRRATNAWRCRSTCATKRPSSAASTRPCSTSAAST